MTTVAELRSWSPGGLEDAAQTCARAMGRMSDVADDWERAAQVLTQEWVGLAGTAARAALTLNVRDANTMVAAIDLARRILYAAADAIRAAQGELAEALRLADDHHLVVSATGQAMVNPVYELADEPQAEYIAAVTDLARAALAAAAEADRDAAVALAAVLGHAADGTTSGDAGRDLISAIGASDVPTGATPAQVSAWWAALPDAARALLLARHPESLGNLDGLPAGVRHQANRAVLAAELADARADLEAFEAVHPGNLTAQVLLEATRLRARVEMLESVQTQLAGGPDRHLLILDPTLPGLAAIAIGDVDTADHIGVLVPGFATGVTGDLSSVTRDAVRLQDANEWLLAHSGESVATVAWIGYHAPDDLVDVAVENAAHTGADQLNRTLQGLHDSRGPGMADPHITVVGHSYGSLVAGIALGDGPGPVDDAVMIGSPGLSTNTVDGLNLSPDNVFVGAADGDIVSILGRFGRRPDSDYFGATVFQTDGGAHPSAPGATLPSSGHSEYYDEQSESLYNIASVVTGQSDQVTLVPTEGER